MADDLVYFNGVDATTGELLFPPISESDLAAMIRGEPVDPDKLKNAEGLLNLKSSGSLGMAEDESPTNLSQAGWAVVFHKDEDPAVKQELMRLYDHRCKQVDNPKRVKVLEYADEADYLDWLQKYKVAAGSVRPERVPFYLLLVGGPERIPFNFVQMLNVEYGVGLLQFDAAEQYRQYVDSVIGYETGDAEPRAKEAVFFRTNKDRATALSALHLVGPLADGVPETDSDSAQPPVAEAKGFATRRIWDDQATSDGLAQVFAPPAGQAPPAFLFSATHGVGFMQPDPQQQPGVQGALKCQDGVKFSADLLAGTPNVRAHGLIAFLFACYSAGTPQVDQYVQRLDRTPLTIADKPFLAALPKALLSHPQGGALACIGHVERAWNYSFSTSALGDQLQPYQNAVRRILGGLPVGYALKDMRERYVSLAAWVGNKLQDLKFGASVPDADLIAAWAERNDAGGYMLIGDPAVRLRQDKLV
jgi:hypothetical protein